MWWSRRCSGPGRAGVALGALLVLSACAGYRWTDTDPEGAKAPPVAVPAFANDTLEPNLGAVITGLLRTRLLEGGIRLMPDASRRLTGRVTELSDEVLAFDADGRASHRRIVVTVEVSLTDGGTPRWERRPVRVSAEYPVTEDATGNRDAKDRALEEASVQLADTLIVDLAEIGVRP